jgi:hypothetical protein
VDQGLHPDPAVAEGLPNMLERLFGVQLTCEAFMNCFLPKLGGYVDSSGLEVHRGKGLPLLSDPACCAESLLVWLRQWSEAEDIACASGLPTSRDAPKNLLNNTKLMALRLQRGRDFNMESVLQELRLDGHTSREMKQLLEGEQEVPRHVLEVPAEKERYHISDAKRRAWELATDQHHDLIEMLGEHHRDLGPYANIEIDAPEQLSKLWGSNKTAPGRDSMVCVGLQNAELTYRKSPEEEFEESGYSARFRRSVSGAGMRRASLFLQTDRKLSDWFGLRLVDWPADLGSGSASSSTFVKFFSEGTRSISRRDLNGLPALPWAFGSDNRNTIIVDGMKASSGLAPFHCMFVASTVQPWRACVVPLGNKMAQSHIICPKYQPIQLMNGDRLVCHSWTFEMRIQAMEHTIHQSALSILTDEGDIFDVPWDGCHVGAGNRSRHLDQQPAFPHTKFALKHRLANMAAVHLAIHYHAPTDRWTLVDHSPDPMGTLLQLRAGVAHPLSHGLRVKMGPIVLEATLDLEE